MITRSQISKAIKAKHNLEVDVFCGDGCCHFFAKEDSNGVTIDEALASRLGMTSTGVMVAKLNHLSLEQWVESFEDIYGI